MGCMSSKSAAAAGTAPSSSEGVKQPLLSGKEAASYTGASSTDASSAPSTSPEKMSVDEDPTGRSPGDSNPASSSSPSAALASFTSPVFRAVKEAGAGSAGLGSPTLRNGRQVPGVLLTGGEFISIGNTAVSSLLVRNIGPFSSIHSQYSTAGQDGSPAMCREDLQRCLSEYNILPAWLSATELGVIFNAVRGPADTPSATLGLDSGGMNECLARVALFYAPDSDATFDMSMEDLSQSTQFAELFVKLLEHMDQNKPAGVTHATFNTKKRGKKGRRGNRK